MRDFIGNVMFMFIIIVGLLIGSYFETTYTQKAKVIEVKSESVIVENNIGRRWEIQDCGLTCGDKVELTLYDNHTINNFKDDEIKRIKKIK